MIEGETSEFEKLYIEVRSKEKRIYTNAEVALLPDIYPQHTHYKEWQIRKVSVDRFLAYLNKKKALRILEVGCGNGWLSAKIAGIANADVTGIDVNITELKQAEDVFSDRKNLHFIAADISKDELGGKRYDLIFFATTLSYFPTLRVLNNAMDLLNNEGEIHILDTFFYRQNEIKDARLNTKKYFESMGVPEMADHYFHHSFEDLQPFGYEMLYDPSLLVNKLLYRRYPFYWMRINKQ